MGGSRHSGDNFGKDAAFITIEKIINGDEQLRAEFIEDHKLFILKTVSNALGKSAVPKNSEEFSTGLDAFNYAVDHYTAMGGGLSFLIYCEQVIREFISTYHTQNQQNKNPYSKESWDRASGFDNTEVSEELMVFKQKLWGFGITLKDLVQTSPKNTHSMGQSLKIAKLLATDLWLYNKLCSSKRIPSGEVLKLTKGSERTIERNKKYIIALCLLLNSGLGVVKGYITNLEKGLHSSGNSGIVLELSKKEAVIMTAQGRFIMIRSSYNMQIGRQITFGKSSILRFKGNYLRYAALIALVIVAFIGVFSAYRFLKGLTGIDFDVLSDKIGLTSLHWPQDNNKENSVSDKSGEPVEEPDKASKKNTAVPEKAEGKKAPGPTSAKDKASGKEKRSTPEPKKPAKATESKSKVLSLTSPPVASIKPSVIPSYSAEPKPTTQPIPTGYPTLRATGVPGVPQLNADVYEVGVGEEYTISMNMDKGNNGTAWILYENGKPVATRRYADNSPNEQVGMRLFTAKQPGKYIYRCELINAFGSTSSGEITITVR